MSEYTDPSYQEATSAGAYARGGDAAYGDEGPAYGDEGPAYGDEGPAYGDEGPAYGDHGAYQEDVAYGDAGAYGDHGQVSYGNEYDQAAEYDPYADPDQLYADDDGGIYADETADPYAPEEAAAPAKKGKKAPKVGGKSKKPLILAAVGLALVGALGAGGYFLFMAPSSEGGEAGSGFDLSSLTKMIPFLGPKDSEETLATNQANLMAVKRAVDTYIKENGKLPSTSSAIETQMEKIGVELSHPYDPNLPVPIELGEAPTGPGVIAYTPKGKSYELRVGDVAGKAVMEGESEMVLNGDLKGGGRATPMAAKPAGGAKPTPASAAPDEEGWQTPASAKPGQMQMPTQTRPPGMGPDDEDYIETADPPEGGETGSTTAQATPPPAAPLPKATPTPPPTPLAVLRKRNQEFDKLRNQGIGLLYEKRTAEAIVAFRRALLIKPNDPTVRRWLETIQGVVDKHTYEEAQRLKKDRAELLQRARMVAPPPAPVPDAQRREHEAMKLLDELKEDRAPALAAPKLEN